MLSAFSVVPSEESLTVSRLAMNSGGAVHELALYVLVVADVCFKSYRLIPKQVRYGGLLYSWYDVKY